MQALLLGLGPPSAAACRLRVRVWVRVRVRVWVRVRVRVSTV